MPQKISGYDWLEQCNACRPALKFVKRYRGRPFRVTFNAVAAREELDWIDWLRIRLNVQIPQRLQIDFEDAFGPDSNKDALHVKWNEKWEAAINHVLGFTPPRTLTKSASRKRSRKTRGH